MTPSQPPSDDERNAIVQRIQSGDQSALSVYVEDQRERLLATITRKMSDGLRAKVEPQDVMQEVLVSAFDSYAALDWSDRDPFHWLCQLADRKIIDAHRYHIGAKKRSGEKEVSLQRGNASEEGELIDLLIMSMTSPSAAFARDQKGQRLQMAIAALPDDSREAVKLRYVDGLPTKEIAEQLGRTDAAIRVLLTRTIKRLQAALSDDTWFRETQQ